MGPWAEKLYAVEPVGVATMTPSAAYVVKNFPLIDTANRTRCPLLHFSRTASFRASHFPGGLPVGVDDHGEHHPLRDLGSRRPGARRSAFLQLGRLDLGEEARAGRG